MARSTTLFIAACWLLGSNAAWPATPETAMLPATDCVKCHETARGVLSGPMATRLSELRFARRAFGAGGDRFFAESCGGCHVTGCGDCHGNDPHTTGRPKDDVCLRCHHGYSAGWEFTGRAVREDHARYRRGATAQGEPFLKMLPDIHSERGMSCADCHTMKSLHEGKRTGKECRDCHSPSASSSPEHAIAGHLTKLTCTACHSAWASQEYGTFLIRPATAEQREAFQSLPAWGPWRKSTHLKRQDAPPLGLDERGLVSPIRPRFLLFVTDPRSGWENQLVAAEWRAFSPHTVRLGSVACGGCHDNRRRFLLENDAERIHLLEKDGLPLRSYWSREKQTMIKGTFFPLERFERMNTKTPEYARQVVKRWQKLLEHAAPQSDR